MAKYYVHEISILLQAAGIKAGIDAFDKKGFTQLADVINEGKEKSPYNIEVTERYLKETIFKELEKAEQENNDSLGLSQDHIETLCNYLNYSSFSVFQESLKAWSEKLMELHPDLNALFVLYNPTLQKLPAEFKQALDQSKLEYQTSTTGKDDALNDLVQKAFLVIAVVNQSLQLNEAGEKLLSEINKTTPNSLLFYHSTKEEIKPALADDWKRKRLVLEKDLLLVLLLVKLHISGGRRNDPNEKKAEKRAENPIIIGTSIHGNQKVKAEYFSNKDMHITINKGKN